MTTITITINRATVEQALEALEQAHIIGGQAACDTAITALRAALAQQAEAAACSNTFGCRCPKHFAVEQAEPVEPVEPVGAAGLFTLAHLWAQQCYFKGLGRPCDIDSARGAFEQALKAYTAPPQLKPLPKHDQHCVDVPGYGLMAVRLVRAVERAHGITDPQIADRLARHGIPMPGDPK